MWLHVYAWTHNNDILGYINSMLIYRDNHQKGTERLNTWSNLFNCFQTTIHALHLIQHNFLRQPYYLTDHYKQKQPQLEASMLKEASTLIPHSAVCKHFWAVGSTLKVSRHKLVHSSQYMQNLSKTNRPTSVYFYIACYALYLIQRDSTQGITKELMQQFPSWPHRNTHYKRA